MESSLIRLNLRAPLLYIETPGLDPFDIALTGAPPERAPPPPDDASEEFLFCFELDPEQSLSIEPLPEKILGRLVFSGRNVRNGRDVSVREESRAGSVCRLPAGPYLFTQRRRACGRGIAGREECIALAIEQQKDGLWEKLKPGNLLYLRLLYEDDSPVTQLFRPAVF